MGLSYRHLTLAERRTVFHLKAAKASAQAIAARLGRCRSTIDRELARNSFQDVNPYFDGRDGICHWRKGFGIVSTQVRNRTTHEQA